MIGLAERRPALTTGIQIKLNLKASENHKPWAHPAMQQINQMNWQEIINPKQKSIWKDRK